MKSKNFYAIWCNHFPLNFSQYMYLFSVQFKMNKIEWTRYKKNREKHNLKNRWSLKRFKIFAISVTHNDIKTASIEPFISYWKWSKCTANHKCTISKMKSSFKWFNVRHNTRAHSYAFRGKLHLKKRPEAMNDDVFLPKRITKTFFSSNKKCTDCLHWTNNRNFSY